MATMYTAPVTPGGRDKRLRADATEDAPRGAFLGEPVEKHARVDAAMAAAEVVDEGPATHSTPIGAPLPTTERAGIALGIADFGRLRKTKGAFVDKTGAIADLLVSMELTPQGFFVRPRKFGKSLTLTIAAEMLAAGTLPASVEPWPGYVPVDVKSLFGGLAVHERLLRDDQKLGTLLRRPHFVIKLSLGDTLTGSKLEAGIMDNLAGIAGTAFGVGLCPGEKGTGAIKSWGGPGRPRSCNPARSARSTSCGRVRCRNHRRRLQAPLGGGQGWHRCLALAFDEHQVAGVWQPH